MPSYHDFAPHWDDGDLSHGHVIYRFVAGVENFDGEASEGEEKRKTSIYIYIYWVEGKEK